MTKLLLSLAFFFSSPVLADLNYLDDLDSQPLISDEMSDAQLMSEPVDHSPSEGSDSVLMLPEEVFAVEGFDVYQEFPVVIKVSKAANVQQMWVYQQGVLTHSFLVSTGRERWETAKSGRYYFTGTPVGWYQPQRLIRKHYSETWEAYMEYAVFFVGGVALHATTPDHYKELGRRASGGCVRLHKDNAFIIFNLVTSEGRGLVPVVNRHGQVARDRKGNIIRKVGWNTMIIVEDK
jgi:Uncharacterized protein conserved in bacteria